LIILLCPKTGGDGGALGEDDEIFMVTIADKTFRDGTRKKRSLEKRRGGEEESSWEGGSGEHNTNRKREREREAEAEKGEVEQRPRGRFARYAEACR
jgi:hypothetical protein